MPLKKSLYLIIFLIILVFFSFFSGRMGFHDSFEYITFAKYFAGIENIELFVNHSIVYPFIISLFLKIWPSFMTIKLINILWIFLIGWILLFNFKNKTAFILFAFSPLTWLTSIQTTPLLPASFLFLLSYLFFIKKDNKYNLLLSGIFFGLSIAIYSTIILLYIVFAIVNFWKKDFSKFFIWNIFILIGLIPRFILDNYYFGIPIYSFIRFIGNNLVISLGLHPTTNTIQTNFELLLILIAISPMLFKIYKLDFKKYIKPTTMIVIISIILLIRGSYLEYFIIISPLILLLLSQVLSKNEVKLHCILSIILIVFLTWNFFIIDEDKTENYSPIITNDLNLIKKEFKPNYIAAGPLEAIWMATYSWENTPYFIWYQDLQASLENKQRKRGYKFEFNSKAPLRERLTFSVDFNRFSNKSYDDYILVTKSKFEDLENYNLQKCYEVLCVYKRKHQE